MYFFHRMPRTGRTTKASSPYDTVLFIDTYVVKNGRGDTVGAVDVAGGKVIRKAGKVPAKTVREFEKGLRR